MNAKRLWMLGGAVVAVAIAVLAYFVGISPQLADAHAAEQQKIQAQAQLQQTEVALASLKKQYASIGQLTAQLTELQTSVPGTTEVTAFIRQVQDQATASGTAITSITVGEPTAYAPQAAAGAAAPTSSTPAPTASASTGSTATSSPAQPTPGATAPSTVATPSPSVNATAAAVAPPLTADPSITASNFVLLPVSIAASGDQPSVMAFTKELQEVGPRLFLINSIDVKQGAAGAPAGAVAGASAASTGTITGFVYVLVGN